MSEFMTENNYFVRVFKALDTENKDYLVRSDILNFVEEFGLIDHLSLHDLI